MRPQSTTRSHAGRGFNLIEAAIVLGVIGLVIGGIWVAASAVQFNNKVSDTVRMVTTVLYNTRSLYRGQVITPSDLNNTPVIQVVALASDRDGNTLRAPFATSFIGLRIHPDGIQMELSGMPKEACIAIGPRLYTALRTELTTSFFLEQEDLVSESSDGEPTYTPALANANCYAGAGAAVTLRW